jgi:hypothetical protein
MKPGDLVGFPVNGQSDESLFETLVSLYQSNAVLSMELKSVREKLDRARAYLETPGANLLLGEAHVLRLRARHTAALTLLRANRLQARHVLARNEGQLWHADHSD